jgi:hypothetical protein
LQISSKPSIAKTKKEKRNGKYKKIPYIYEVLLRMYLVYCNAQLCTIIVSNKITCQQDKKELKVGLVKSHNERTLTGMCETQGWMAITEKINTQQQQQKGKDQPHVLREILQK